MWLSARRLVTGRSGCMHGVRIIAVHVLHVFMCSPVIFPRTSWLAFVWFAKAVCLLLLLLTPPPPPADVIRSDLIVPVHRYIDIIKVVPGHTHLSTRARG